MLKNPAEYEKDTLSAKFTAIFRQVSTALIYQVSLLVTARDLRWINRERLQLKWQMHNRPVMATVLGMPCVIQALNSNSNLMEISAEDTIMSVA
jgi:hypothetical protein